MKVYKALATAISSRDNCKEAGNDEWFERHSERIEAIMSTAPSGSGFDRGTELDEKSTPEKLLFHFGYHHMDENGYYTHWTHHHVHVKASMLFEFSVRITTAKEEVWVKIRGGLGATTPVMRRPKIEAHDLEYFGDVFNDWLDGEEPECVWINN